MKKNRRPKKKSMKDILTKKERQELREELEQMSEEKRKHIRDIANSFYDGDEELALQRYKVWTEPAIFIGWDEEEGKWKELKG